jgi:starch-binding outer membrane protein, SusD/RagB family
MDLDVVNTNAPDRERAIANPQDLLSFVASAFNGYFNAIHTSNARIDLFMNYATEFTSTTTSGANVYVSVEPRPALDNAAAISVIGPQGPRSLWTSLLESASVSYDGLRLMDQGLVLRNTDNVDVTPQTRAFAKLVQGMAWGYLGVMYDQAPILTEDIEVSEDVHTQMVELLRPADEIIDLALESLAEARTIAQQNTFSYPTYPTSRLWFGTLTPVTSADLVRMTNTLSARYLVLAARDKAGRRAVDWNQVLQFTANGVTRDFEVALDVSYRGSGIYNRASTTGNRWDQLLIGHADTTGKYQAWINSPLATRNRFDIGTPDRRITGTTPTSTGSYTRYIANNGGLDAAFGTYFFSGYQWRRHANRNNLATTVTGNETGTAPLITVDENNLLRAEALIHTGNLAGAATLINITRTRAQRIGTTIFPTNLPPVTAAGVPVARSCVPKDDEGNCGDLMEALWYERMIELAGLDMLRGYADSRGFGLLPTNSWTQLPVPGNTADMVDMEVYTFGGGGPGSAVYAPATMADAQ